MMTIKIIGFLLLFSLVICCENTSNQFVFSDKLLTCLSDSNLYSNKNTAINLNTFVSKNDSIKIVIPLYLLEDIFKKSSKSNFNIYKDFLKSSLGQKYQFDTIVSGGFNEFKLKYEIQNEYQQKGTQYIFDKYFKLSKVKNIEWYELLNQSEMDLNTRYSIFYYLFQNGYTLIEDDYNPSYYAVPILVIANCK